MKNCVVLIGDFQEYLLSVRQERNLFFTFPVIRLWSFETFDKIYPFLVFEAFPGISEGTNMVSAP